MQCQAKLRGALLTAHRGDSVRLAIPVADRFAVGPLRAVQAAESGDRQKRKAVIFAYFVNAVVCGLAFAFPDREATVFNAIHSAFVSSRPYAEGGLALAFLAFVWLSPVVVMGFLFWLVIDAFSSVTAAKIKRR